MFVYQGHPFKVKVTLAKTAYTSATGYTHSRVAHLRLRGTAAFVSVSDQSVE